MRVSGGMMIKIAAQYIRRGAFHRCGPCRDYVVRLADLPAPLREYLVKSKMTRALGWAIAVLGLGLTTSPLAALLGWHDQTSSTTALGWTCDTANYSRTVTVRIYRSTSGSLSSPGSQGAELLGSTSANVYRADLGGVCGGIYVHSFSFTYPTSANNGGSYYIYAVGVTQAGTEQLLTNSPLYTTFPAGQNKLPLGYQDFVQLNASSRMEVIGWACDPDLPAAAMTVDIYASRSNLADPVAQGATLIGNVLANGYNASLANYPQFCASTTYHNFTYVLPNSMHDGATWYVWTYVRDSAGGPRARLWNTPIARTFPNLAPLGFEDFVQLNASNRMQVTGWGCDPSLPAAAMMVDIYASRSNLADPLTQGGINVGSVLASGYNASLANYPDLCARTTNHNFTYVLPDSMHDGTIWYVYGYVRDSSGGTAARLWNTPLSSVFPNLSVPYSSKYMGASIPGFFEIGFPTPIQITMANNGSQKWTVGNFFLATENPQDNKYWCIQNTGAENRVPLPYDVPPGSNVTFAFTVLPGTCGAPASSPLTLKMLSPTVGTFGEQSPDNHVIVGYGATFVPPVRIAGAMDPGSNNTVTVSMKNTGIDTWTTAAGYKLGSANPLGNSTWGLSRVALPGTIAPGQTAVFKFNVLAPFVPGNYNFQWQMLQEGVKWFGLKSTNVVVKVASGSGAPPLVEPIVNYPDPPLPYGVFSPPNLLPP
jgi:hypothetical protein